MKSPSLNYQWIESILLKNSILINSTPSKTKNTNEFYTEVSTDTRSLKKGALFAAIKGDQFDGHAFLQKATELGSSAVLSELSFKDSKITNEVDYFQVKDVTNALRFLAQAWREQFEIPIIAITGSVGKTSTKELVSACFKGKHANVLSTRASENGYLGIALTLLRLEKSHQAAIIEIGIDEPGAMEKHLEVVDPTSAILTTIGPEHLEKLINIKTVAKEELLSLHWVDEKNGAIAINADDPLIESAFNETKKPNQHFFSLGNINANYSVTGSLDSSKNLLKINNSIEGEKNFEIPLPLPGEHNARNLLGAVCIALANKVTPAEIKKGLKDFFTQPFGRSETVTLNNGVTVYCDFYNSNPTSLNAALEVTKKYSPPKWLCLGDMLELGEEEKKYHTDIALKLLKDFNTKNNHILLYGKRMRWLFEEMKKSQYLFSLAHFEDIQLLSAELSKNVQKNDFVLLKGSRGMKMESIYEHLKKNS